jgi:hypothetical protein
MSTDFLSSASFGHYGSVYLPASGSIDLTGSSASRYVTAILIIGDDSSFAALEALNGEVGQLSTVTAELDLDDVTTGIGAAANGTTIASITMRTGTVIYGKWDLVTLNSSSSCICYFAPKLHS